MNQEASNGGRVWTAGVSGARGCPPGSLLPRHASRAADHGLASSQCGGRAQLLAASNRQPAGLHPARRFLICLATWVLATAPWMAHADEPEAALELLKKNRISTGTPGVIAYLARMLPDAELDAQIAALVARLGDPGFANREAAADGLSAFGEAARKSLKQATQSKDPEVGWRAGKILRKLDSGDQSRLRQSLTLAAVEVLHARRDPQATPVLLSILGMLGDAYGRETAAEALWAGADATQADILEAALDHRDTHVRAAAVVAYEVAVGERAVPRIAPLLKDEEAPIRLAAARALIDREPELAVEALVSIAGAGDQDLAWQADALLEMKTGHRAQPEGDQALGDAWKKWAADEAGGARLDRQLGDDRLDLSAGRNFLEEAFARDADSLAKGYGRFLYEADNGGAAKVAGGVLRIDGNNAEGDQRLFITSQRMIGRDRWPGQVDLRVKLGGVPGNTFGWHMGVSIGRVKVLFHPGLPGGGFRAETTDSHAYIFGNENMSFEPVSGVIHEMAIRVTKTNTGADFDVTVTGGNGGPPHRKKFSADREQLGDYDRIGLERSGRTGGDALFDSISIRLGAE